MNNNEFSEIRDVIQKNIKTSADLEQVYIYASNLMGWGWSATLPGEVDACLNIFKYEPKTFVDIGANKGFYTDEVLKRKPNVECHLFEPSSTNVEVLEEKFSSMDNVHLCRKGLSYEEAELELYADKPGSGLGSLTKRNLDHTALSMDTSETVKVIRFDEYWEEGKPLDYVKVDVEGHELDVLRGFGDLLSTVRVLQFEFGGANVDTRTHFRDFWKFFTDNEFNVFRMSPFGPLPIRYWEIHENYCQGNYIAVNTRQFPN